MLLFVSLLRYGFFMCVSPITLHRKYGKYRCDYLVPCGKCAECLKKRQNGIVVRSIEESRKLGRMWFITLTYSNDSAPKLEFKDDDTGEVVLVNSLRREDVKKWKRDVRQAYFKAYNKPFPSFSYIICGEYGPRTQRPHYHGVLFGLDNFHANYLQEYWQSHFGFTSFKSIISVSNNGRDDVSNVARYVSKYCVKPEDVEHPLVKDGVIEKPRLLTSIGFGLPADFENFSSYIRCGHDLSDNISPSKALKISSRCKYTYNGISYGLPLYYRKKIFYETGITKNLVQSKLGKVCSNTLQRYRKEDSNREFRKLVSGKSEREAIEAVSRFVEGEKGSFVSRQNVADASIKRSYKSSKF